MIFSIKPSSGFDNSYYDIEFNIDFINPLSEPFEVEIFNKTAKQKLNILAISSGIIEDNIAKSQPVVSLDGIINLFNDDKMNVNLQNFLSVEIECVVKTEKNEYRESVSFFNEALSSDNDVIPFEIIVPKEVDLEENYFFTFEIISDYEKIFHMSIDDIDSIYGYDFYIFTKIGKSTIKIPLNILNYELGLYKNSSKKFQLCYMKEHGINFLNVVNKKKIKINGTELRFVNFFSLKNQTRLDPLFNNLNENDFILSDRYFVPTWHEYSFYSNKRVDPDRNFYSKLLVNELIENRIKKKFEIKKVVENYWDSEEKRNIAKNERNSGNFYKIMHSVYDNSTKLSVGEKLKKTGQLKMSETNSSGCSKCGRKNRN